MKSILILLILFILISCNRPKYHPETIIIISGEDSVMIETNSYYKLTHLGSKCGGHGHNDTLTGIFYLTFLPCDDVRVTGIGIEYDSSTYILNNYPIVNTVDTIYIREPLYVPYENKKKKK